MAKILYVDDDGDQQERVSRILTEEGCEVTLAGDGVEAKELFEVGEFDLVITDGVMERMSGYELRQAIRDIEHAAHVPINERTPIILTTGGILGSGDSEFSAIFPKPVPEMLVRMMAPRPAK